MAVPRADTEGSGWQPATAAVARLLTPLACGVRARARARRHGDQVSDTMYDTRDAQQALVLPLLTNHYFMNGPSPSSPAVTVTTALPHLAYNGTPSRSAPS